MSILKPKKISTIIFVYWFLLLYIIAVLVFWFISLNKQNHQMADLLINELKLDDPFYQVKADKILDAERRKIAQYIGEGSTFLALILLGAVFVYRATRRQLRLSQQQQNFMMAVTHELKTPIAVTRLNLETLQKRKLEEAQQQKLIGNTLQEVSRLNSLCNNILLASQLDAGSYKISKNEVNLSEVAERSVAEFVQRFSQRKITAEIAEDVFVVGEELLLQMLVNNLIENATKYGGREGEIRVLLEAQRGKVILVVKDQGTGIADDEKEKVFEKFYRIGNEETRTAKGTGLGLYLCKRIADDHNAKIEVTDNKPKGAIFTVTFKT
ncbi:MAG: two-component sensor histidine kinase [Segetibacter sp.]|nr:two-component sensor histidine kinase [Segetibacter sp.]